MTAARSCYSSASEARGTGGMSHSRRIPGRQITVIHFDNDDDVGSARCARGAERREPRADPAGRAAAVRAEARIHHRRVMTTSPTLWTRRG